MDKDFIKKRIDPYPKTVLGIIALFVFFTEAVATVSLKFALDASSPYIAHLVWFIVLYPVLLTFLFFYTLWYQVQKLYPPMDFGSAKKFVKTIEDISSDSNNDSHTPDNISENNKKDPNNTIEPDARTSRGSL
ncbi:MAG: hypothetical protein GY774_37675 [Planctomycetes bacterium]|nr:hypothetical protein [Planctomycetota bacterium]